MNPMRKLALMLLLCSFAAHAQDKDKVYRYTDAKGVVHYTDKPPSKDAKPAELPPLQTFPAGGRTNFSSPNVEQKKPPSFTLAITSPAPDTTVRDSAAAIPVEVSVTPPMPQGYGMKFSADGAALHDGVLDQPSFSVSGLERGSHTITATLFNADGKEMGSASVNVHFQKPVVKP